jgi:hypothetical protein
MFTNRRCCWLYLSNGGGNTPTIIRAGEILAAKSVSIGSTLWNNNVHISELNEYLGTQSEISMRSPMVRESTSTFENENGLKN